MLKTLAALTLTIAIAATSFAGQATAAAWSKQVSPAELSALDGALLIDIRSAKGHAAGHPEGAVNAPYPLWRGPADNPGQVLSDDALTKLLRSIGVTHDRPTVVVYEGANPTDFGAAARVYWTLKSAGVERIAILDGGVAAWAEAGLPLSTAIEPVEASDIVATFSDEWLATREDVAAIVSGDAAGQLVDARPDAFLAGHKKHPAAAKAGTLTGADQFVFGQWFKGNDPAIGGGLLARYAKPAGQGPIVSFCNTGHWAATNWFMMSEVQGLEGVKLYAESMVGWTNAGGDVATR